MRDFTLEPLATPAPVEKVCGDCVHYRPHRDDQTGRVHPSKWGRCGWKPPRITWPMAFKKSDFGEPQDPFFTSSQVFTDTRAERCECFTETLKK